MVKVRTVTARVRTEAYVTLLALLWVPDFRFLVVFVQFRGESGQMRKLLLSSALVAGLCVPALAQNQGGNSMGQNGGGHTRGAPGPVAGAGLPVIALGLGGLGIYWLVSRRRRIN
jgi:hypothetical protein